MTSYSATILLTRPAGQHEKLASLCESLGLTVKHLPCIAIAPLPDVASLRLQLHGADSILFTSRNAVLHAHAQIPLPWSGKKIHAIGPATAATLMEFSQPVNLEPAPPFNSESYLVQLRAFEPQQLLIIKGSGGRNLIEPQLQALNWQVQTVDVYQRNLPIVDKTDLKAIFSDAIPDIVSVTSDESLRNLKTLALPYWEHLENLPLIVNSERCSALARSLGFTQRPRVARVAGDVGQLEQLEHWLKSRKT